ncbi:acetamidase/formamidase family protein [uncultured Clostridium sp.]|uniref:acetamidase/formamidase family protein n=1 Tax=uncultured Clostridium sp. TaxID=59620 RepID=UPI0028EAF2AC|nr:acetamidase/formamidase family protein [uncultured Clostridium sp.]
MVKEFDKSKVIYEFSPNNKGVYFVKEGEEFWVETEDCYGGQIRTEKDLRSNIDSSAMNPSTGPIVVDGAEEGDVLCVEVLDIILDNQGVMGASPRLGVLGDKIKEYNTKIILIKDNRAYFDENIVIPVQSMIGVIGVSPKKESISCVTPGKHGANMDTKEICKGSKVYLPVFVKGANLAVGDLHASMGDGELSGTGIEIGGKVKLKVRLIKNKTIRNPRVDSKDYLITIASATSYKEAIAEAVDDMVEVLKELFNLKFEDAYRLLGATCDLRISQIVNPLITVKVCAPKEILKLEGFNF